MNDTVTHAAGPAVSFMGRVIQRCAVCGCKLADNQNTAMPMNADGTPPVFPVWSEGALVQVEEGNPTRYSVIGEFGGKKPTPVPEDFCIALVEG